jgi:hypothetical protein
VHTSAKYAKYGWVTILHVENGFAGHFACRNLYVENGFAGSTSMFNYVAGIFQPKPPGDRICRAAYI